MSYLEMRKMEWPRVARDTSAVENAAKNVALIILMANRVVPSQDCYFIASHQFAFSVRFYFVAASCSRVIFHPTILHRATQPDSLFHRARRSTRVNSLMLLGIMSYCYLLVSRAMNIRPMPAISPLASSFSRAHNRV